MGFEQLPVSGPFKGIVDNLPRPSKPPNAFDDLLNFMVYRGRLITRPRLNAFGNPPDGAVVRLMVGFYDILNNLHDLLLTTKTAYMLTSGPVYNALTLPGGITDLTGTALPYGYALFNSRVYFSNGSVVGLYSDGEASVKSSGHPGAWRYAGVLGNHLVTLATTEPAPGSVGSTFFPRRLRWSASGDGNTWTTGAGSTAGYIDMLDIPDFPTGFTSLSRAGYIFRSSGISLMSPTGVGISPFQIDHVSIAPKGVGNFYPYSLDTYGGLCAFAAEQDIYVFDGTAFTAIGTEAKKKIYADISTSGVTTVYGMIVPKLGPGMDYLSYWLSLPSSTAGTAVTWVYSWDDQAWQRFSSSSGQLTAIANMVI